MPETVGGTSSVKFSNESFSLQRQSLSTTTSLPNLMHPYQDGIPTDWGSNGFSSAANALKENVPSLNQTYRLESFQHHHAVQGTRFTSHSETTGPLWSNQNSLSPQLSSQAYDGAALQPVAFLGTRNNPSKIEDCQNNGSTIPNTNDGVLRQRLNLYWM